MGLLQMESLPRGQHPPNLFSVKPAAPVSSAYMQKYSPIPIAPFYWGAEFDAGNAKPFPRQTGNVETRELIGDGSVDACHSLINKALDALGHVFDSIDLPNATSQSRLVELKLSPQLARWKKEKQDQGRVLPCKGRGLVRTTDKVVDLVGGSQWPAPILTDNALFGSGWANLLIGAYSPEVLYSNYCVDMAFYYEHGYDVAFPEFESLILDSSNDPHARNTFAGPERREGAKTGLRYIRSKIALETKYVQHLAGKSAVFDRRTAQCIMFSESSLVGMGTEAITRGYDAAAVMSSLVFSSPGTDVIDVGSDLGNSETLNSFLNTANITDTGIVTEEALRDVYDAYSHTCARMFTEQWTIPTVVMSATLGVWHTINQRHMFLRRAILGYEKVRRTEPDLREGDVDEVFNEAFHTTGSSRPLKNACDGNETCNQVTEVIEGHERHGLLARLWWYMVIGPLRYVRAGIVSPEQEDDLSRDLKETLAECWHEGLIHESRWLLCHAVIHMWQVNFLMEAAMWGSFLDDGALNGKLDRIE